MMRAQDLIEKIVAKATSDDCVVIITDKTQANLRWANSTLTTNGVIQERAITIIAFVAMEGGMAAGAISRTQINENEISSAIDEAIRSARSAGPAEDAQVLAKDIQSGNWDSEHSPTDSRIFARLAPELGEVLQKSTHDAIELFGYAEHTH